jgi:hypothetical protein
LRNTLQLLELDHQQEIDWIKSAKFSLALEILMEDANEHGGPALSAEAGLTADAARVAHGYADDDLHAGFISKQHPLPAAAASMPHGTALGDRGPPNEVVQALELEGAEDREQFGSGEAGLTTQAAGVAGGFVDNELHAGFISKQTPLH